MNKYNVMYYMKLYLFIFLQIVLFVVFPCNLTSKISNVNLCEEGGNETWKLEYEGDVLVHPSALLSGMGSLQ